MRGLLRYLFFTNPDQADATDENEKSVAVLIASPGAHFLFTGDMGEKSAAYLVNTIQKTMPDLGQLPLILQIPHHGFTPAATRVLIQGLHPKIAVISSAYKMDHPRIQESRRIIKKENIMLLNTGQDGSISFRYSNSHWQIRAFKDGRWHLKEEAAPDLRANLN